MSEAPRVQKRVAPTPEPNIRSHEEPDAPPDLMPKDDSHPKKGPDAGPLRVESSEDRPNSSSEPE